MDVDSNTDVGIIPMDIDIASTREDEDLENRRHMIRNVFKNTTKQSIKDVSFRPRFRYNYGLNQELYEKALRYKDLWQDKLFYVDEAIVRQQRTEDISSFNPATQTDRRDIYTPYESHKIEKEPFLKAMGLPSTHLNIRLMKDGKTINSSLGFQDEIKLDHIGRNGAIVNTGCSIVAMKWLGQSHNCLNPGVQYLAVSVINGVKGINSIPRSPEVSIFSSVVKDNSNIRSGIQIWKYELHSKELKLINFLWTESLGVCSNIDWLTDDSSYGEETVGILAGTFSDGKLHFIKILENEHTPIYEKLTKSSCELSVKDKGKNDGNPVVSITCYDFLAGDKIIFGTNAGSIGEFVLSNHEHNGEHSENTDYKLSYIHTVTDSPVSSIKVGAVEGKNYIFVKSTGRESLVFEENFMSRERIMAYPTFSYLGINYNPMLRIFIHTDSWDSIAYSFLRHPQEKPSFLIRLDGMISSFQSAQRSEHPMLLVGNTKGEVIILNVARKILNSAKSTNKFLIPLKLWEFTYSEDNDLIEIDANYESLQNDDPNILSISPIEITISTLAWNENSSCSSLYAAATSSGLLSIERLDPNANKVD